MMTYPSFPAEADVEAAIPIDTILRHCVIDQTDYEMKATGEFDLLVQYRNAAIETAMDYQNTGFSLDSHKTRQAILLMIASMWRNRENDPEGRIGASEKKAAFHLLDFRREGII